ncbi:hypothetical protein NY63_21210 [Xanthomonas citri pv. fuscans]|nr:hypothetical protein NY63_21210 [Xanthomonas citri pv. fuscans]
MRGSGIGCSGLHCRIAALPHCHIAALPHCRIATLRSAAENRHAQTHAATPRTAATAVISLPCAIGVACPACLITAGDQLMRF